MNSKNVPFYSHTTAPLIGQGSDNLFLNIYVVVVVVAELVAECQFGYHEQMWPLLMGTHVYRSEGYEGEGRTDPFPWYTF